VHDALSCRRQPTPEDAAARPVRSAISIPETQRSRATMWDVVRFTEYHQYEAIIVENVVEVVRTWPLFWTWWQAMEALGYLGQLVSLNSMFALPTPQSRDRIYIVWTKGRKWKPDVAISPMRRA
jgi:DNA (cytosine-5)-methyltransferase 1